MLPPILHILKNFLHENVYRNVEGLVMHDNSLFFYQKWWIMLNI